MITRDRCPRCPHKGAFCKRKNQPSLTSSVWQGDQCRITSVMQGHLFTAENRQICELVMNVTKPFLQSLRRHSEDKAVSSNHDSAGLSAQEA